MCGWTHNEVLESGKTFEKIPQRACRKQVEVCYVATARAKSCLCAAGIVLYAYPRPILILLGAGATLV